MSADWLCLAGAFPRGAQTFPRRGSIFRLWGWVPQGSLPILPLTQLFCPHRVAVANFSSLNSRFLVSKVEMTL